MTPAARVQAAIEILDAVIAAARTQGASADRIAAEWFRARRFVGSKDRRAVRDLTWDAIRACGEVPVSGRAAVLRLAASDPALTALFDGTNYGPPPIGSGERIAGAGVAPVWLEAKLAASGLVPEEQAALLARAPLEIRANRLRITREDLAALLPVASEPTIAPDGLRLPAGTNAEAWDAFADGLFEVQDSGSQLACRALDVHPGESVVDLCAGGGGKTLALAAAMRNHGRLLACDVDRTRLSRLPVRAARAGALAETRLLDPGREAEALADWAGAADAVLVDAPCSGTGTWRRSPETRWRLSPPAIARYAATQAYVLRLGARLVKSGGRLTYVVCSLLDDEGADVVRGFLSENGDWVVANEAALAGTAHGPGLRLTPLSHGTDGFFFTTLRRL